MKIVNIVKKFEKEAVFNLDYKSDFQDTNNELKLHHFEET